MTGDPHSRHFLLAALLAALMAAGCSGATLPQTNLHHAHHLSQTVLIGDREALAVWIYAEAPDFRLVAAAGEGFTCVDDVARLAVVMLLHTERTGSAKSRDAAIGMLEFVQALQAEDGQFYNFLNEDRTINKDGETSFKDHGWWAGRALWALGTGARVLAASEPERAGEWRAAAKRLLPWYDPYLESYGSYDEVDGVRVPGWLIHDAADMTSEAVLGLVELYRAEPSSDLARLIAAFCDGLAAFQAVAPGTPIHGMHPSNVQRPRLWHHWGSRQTMALARAARFLPDHPHREQWLESATLEADVFFRQLLDTHIPEEIHHDRVKPYPQIAYGVNTILLGALELYRATGKSRFRDMALEAWAWYAGDNPARTRMYDPATGRCLDGIRGPEEVNPNSGAESTIEALLALEELKQNQPAVSVP